MLPCRTSALLRQVPTDIGVARGRKDLWPLYYEWEHKVGNLVGVKFACRDSVQHLELFDEDRIGKELRDVVLIADRLDVHNGFAVGTF
jgi:hypothetical protein